tara:strand:+ start:2327 stop:2470 length:144 start_codon:yes stop_codon:yes gene_type:complete
MRKNDWPYVWPIVFKPIGSVEIFPTASGGGAGCIGYGGTASIPVIGD